MDSLRKSTYRYLLYRALLDIRRLAWLPAEALQSMNSRDWESDALRIRSAGAIADWLHNLAMFSATDFKGFDESRFWRELQEMDQRHPEYELLRYQGAFEAHLAESQRPSSPN